MKTFALFLIISFTVNSQTQSGSGHSVSKQEINQKLQNPFSVKYLKTSLRKSVPRLILTPAIENNLKNKIKTDPVVKNYYAAIRLNAKEILTQPLLTRKVVGFRLLATSREMLYRMGILSMVYRIEKDPEILKRIDKELTTVCNFSDWNPVHYLDVAEMSMAVAIALDWTGHALPKSTVELAKTSLINKGIEPSFRENGAGWATRANNWNQVCNGGMIAAAIVIAEIEPELAAKTISRALDGMPYALKQYAPAGIYPEGATYWGYGTSFSVCASSMLESAFGTDFGISEYPSFLESANFIKLAVAPSGWYFNFADCGDREDGKPDVTLAWFAKQTGNPLYLQKERFLESPGSMGKLERLAGPGLIWLSQVSAKEEKPLPLAWGGKGPNPVVIFRGEEQDPLKYYFGGKGGRADIGHGNMDAGSFIFELNGVRWAVDPGNQDYNTLNQVGFRLSDGCQDCPRWMLLTKSNYGHSTLIVDDARFNAAGSAPLVDFKSGNTPEATFEMTGIYKGYFKSAYRKFTKDTGHSITIEDQFIIEDSMKFKPWEIMPADLQAKQTRRNLPEQKINHITWAMITTADVIPVEGGAILKQDGKELRLKISSPEDMKVSIIMLDPPPLKLDKRIENLKRIEIRAPGYLFPDGKGTITVRLLSGE